MTILQDLTRRGQAFAADRKGAIAVVVSLCLVPMVIAAGSSLDLARAYVTKTRLLGTIDAAALAVGSSHGSESELRTMADNFIAANYQQDRFGAPIEYTVTITNERIIIEALATMNTTLMRVAGINNLEIAAETEVIRETKGVEVALVLDVTGSMAGSKIADLRVASQSMIDTLFGEEQNPDHLNVAIIPYSASVNIGDEAINYVEASDAGLYDPGDPDGWKGCVLARPYPEDVRDDPLPANEYYEIYRWQPDTDNRWDDPDTETDFCDTYAGGIPNVGTCDELAPRVTEPHDNNNTGPNLGCPSPIVPLTNDRTLLENTISGLVHWSRGGTFSNTGMVWGWRAISPDPPFDQGVDYDNEFFNKAVVLMTDGGNQFYNWTSDDDGTTRTSSDYTSYHRLSQGRIGSTNRNTANGFIDDRLEEICTNMKAEDIMVFTVTFALNDQDTKDIFRRCASGESRYFDSPSGSELEQAFIAIGKELSNLRIAR